MTLKYLKCFLLSAKMKSFSKAGEKLFLSSTAVAQQISALESEIGVQLFARSNRGIQLTAAGIAFLTEAEEIEKHVQLAVNLAREAAGMEKKGINIGVIGSEIHRIIPSAHEYFMDRYPETEIKYIPTTHLTKESDLESGKIDLAFSYGKDKCESKRMICETILIDKAVCVVPAKHRLAKLECVKLCDLYQEKICMVEEGASDFHDALYHEIKESSFDIQIERRPDNVSGQALMKTRALPYICASMSAPIDRSRFSVLPFEQGRTIEIGIVYRKEKNELVKAYVSAARKAMESIIDDISSEM